MKKIILLFILIKSLIAIAEGQSKFPFPDSIRLYVEVECDTFLDVNDKCIDSKGRRQGRWEYKNEVVYNIPTNDEITKQKYKIEKQDLLIAKGDYKDGKKSGSWCFWNYDTYYSWEHLYWCLFNIEYFSDSIIYRKSYPPYYDIVYNMDSSEIHGWTQISNNEEYWRDKVLFKCKKGNCEFWNEKNPKIIIEECKIDDVEFFVERFNVGMYNRKIKYNRH